MEKKKFGVIILIVIIIAFLAGIIAIMPNMNKQDTNLTFISNSTINEGDTIVIKLTDANGNLLVNQTVNVTVTDSNKTSSYFSVVTNETGFGVSKIDKNAGEYNLTINYGGNDNYNGCNATQKLKINEDAEPILSESSSSPSSSSSSSSSTPRYTKDDVGIYDNVNDVYVWGQYEGGSKADVQADRERIEREGMI